MGEESMNKGTLKHARNYLELAQAKDIGDDFMRFEEVAKSVTKPCRAIGVARSYLRQYDSLDEAIRMLSRIIRSK